MVTHILNTGEAFLSADDRRFARICGNRQPIERMEGPRLTRGWTGAIMVVAIAGLTLAAFAV